jgi:hypothetical protein
MLVVIAALLYATAATFVAAGLAAYRCGAAAQRAAEVEVARQGLPKSILAQHRVRIEESLVELMLPLGIALILFALATLNLAVPDIGRMATWIVQPILLLAGGFITGSQVFVVRMMEAAFQKSPDPAARALDVESVMNVATAAFPAWLRALIVIRFALVTLGSVVILVLLAIG